MYDWLQWRGNFLRASFDSQIVGKNVCSALADAEKSQGEIKHLHVIGVSVGAFAADSCIKIFNKVSEQQNRDFYFYEYFLCGNRENI